MKQEAKGKVIVITSGKGGVGKTTATANIGTGLASLGEMVVVIDADIGLRNLDLAMGLENRVVYDLVNVAEGVCRLKQALVRDKKFDNLYLLPAAQTRSKEAIKSEHMRYICGQLKEVFDYVLIDSPAGIEQGFKNAIIAADMAIVITTPEVSAVRDADRVIGLLEADGKRNPRLVINRLNLDMVRRRDMMSIEDVANILAVNLIGVIPEDENIIVSVNRGIPTVLLNHSLSGQAFKNISRRIRGEDVPFMQLDSKGGFLTKVKRFLSR